MNPAMETELNCSAECSAGDCFIDTWLSDQEAWKLLHKLCALGTGSQEALQRPLSPVLRAVVWTLLSSGILLTFLFLAFTLCCRNNRIVKMSSPNLNILTLCGSVLTYSSGFLFTIEEKSLPPSTSPKAVLQARIWTLCIGTSLVFGPILGKTWRLYRVFTQRIPDKRVIIRDSQLMGLVALLILADIVILTTWGLTDPLQCGKSVRAVVKVVEQDVLYAMSQQEFCSSIYSDMWVVLISILKGSLFLYGMYLAGLTTNVSWPPVNQSVTITAAVCLASLSAALSIPVFRLLHAWPNVVCGVVSGSIFICTLATDCLLFVPQMTQWKQFEDELNPTSSQMAKYFSSPSKSQQSTYSEDEICYLRGENSSMKRLLIEKDAVIDSLQEQVNNAKDKLLKLMTSSPCDRPETDSSTNLNSSSTQTTDLHLEPTCSLLETNTTSLALPLTSAVLLADRLTVSLHENVAQQTGCAEGKLNYVLEGSKVKSVCKETSSRGQVVANSAVSTQPGDASDVLMSDLQQDVSSNTTDNVINLGLPMNTSGSDEVKTSECLAGQTTPMLGNKRNFVSSEQLQEILLDLSVDAATTSIRSPRWDITASPTLDEPSPKFSYRYCYPGISPYIMRKRRPPFHTSRLGSPSYYYPGSAHPTLCKSSDVDFGDIKMEAHAVVCQYQDVDSGNISGTGDGKTEAGSTDVSPGWQRSASKRRPRRTRRRCILTTSSGCNSSGVSFRKEGLWKQGEQYDEGLCYLDSDSSSSEDTCYCFHSPYCNTCAHSHYESMDSTTSETSDSEFGGFSSYCQVIHPVVNFKEDLKPTFV